MICERKSCSTGFACCGFPPRLLTVRQGPTLLVEVDGGSWDDIRIKDHYTCIKQKGSRAKGQGLRIRPRLLTLRQDPTLLVEVDGTSCDNIRIKDHIYMHKWAGKRIKGQGLRIRPRLFTVRQDPTLLVEVDGGSWDRGRANITWHTALSSVRVNLVRGRYTIISPYITDGKFCILMAVTPVALDSGIIQTGNIKSYWGPLLVIW